jgi:hypothetical protein
MGKKLSPDEIMLQGRLSGAQKTRLKRLYDFLYRPSEIAEIVGFEVRQVYRVYIPAGCPHERDDRRHIWINGKAFREWAELVYKKRKLAPGETFCITCKKPVKIIDPIQKTKNSLIYLLSDCPNCGRRLSRIVQKKKKGIY